MHVHVKHNCAPGVMDATLRGQHDQRMRKTQQPHRRNLQRHFLKEWRQHRGYTQEKAAEMLGMDRSNLSKIENSKVPYDQELLELAAEAYRCDVADLLVRDPTQAEAMWSIWHSLKPDQRVTATRLLKALQEDEKAA